MQKLLFRAGNLGILPALERRRLLLRSKAFIHGFAYFFCVCLAFLAGTNSVQAQTSVITTESGTGFTTSLTYLTGNSFITFTVENTNSYDIRLTQVDHYFETASDSTIPTLWYTPTSLSGTVNISAPAWTSIATGAAVRVPSNNIYPTLTNLNFVIPAGAQYRFALVSSNRITYGGATPVPSPTTLSVNGVNLKVHNATVGGSVVGYSGTFPNSSNSPRSFVGRIHFQPTTPCTAPPTAGQAVSSTASVCPNTNFMLSVSGASGGLGTTYQWQSSANGTTGWADITNATSSSYFTSQTATTYYRVQITCSGQTATSAAVQVSTNSSPFSGTYTINKNAPASATNFQSFADAINALTCGSAAGPVVFNVVAGTGPYNELVVMPSIPGASATNTIT
ncbi:MAG: hypothetical protein LPJ89_01280, partial [Hymenobacteraceae bacterium]|nr:hypothetical protein [Hymenobacteraceae bacterium]